MKDRSEIPEQKPLEAAVGLSAVEEKVARRLVAAHRARLDWLLRVPEWESLLEIGVQELGFEGQRQGIGLPAAILALPLESKFQLVRWAMEHFGKHLSRTTAQGMSRVVSVERFNSLELDEVITARQWLSLRSRVSWRLVQEHRRYKNAQQLLYTGYCHLIGQVVAKLVFEPRFRGDSAQEGSLGLLHAIDRVDDGDQEFAAYALTWIRRSVKNFLMRQRLPVHAPVNLVSKATTSRRRSEQSGVAATAHDSKLCILLLEYLRNPAVSLDAGASGDSGGLGDVLADPRMDLPDEAAARADLCAVVSGLVANLTEKQQAVLHHRYGLRGGRAKTLAEIARSEGITHQQVSMREKRALERMQALLQPVIAEIGGRP